jgi:imidazolonepropionase-like amidohydrolase
MTRHAVVAILTAGALAASTAAADAQIIPRAPQEQPIALTGGTIHTVTNGVIENGTIVFVGGRITAVGADVPVPPGAQVIDITGKHVFPGLVDAFSTVGLTEIGGFDQATDLNELGDINPNVHAEVAVNPESRHIGTTRSNGVLVTVASPSGGLISGMAAAMMLEGWTWEEMTIKSEAGLIVNWPSPRSPRRSPPRAPTPICGRARAGTRSIGTRAGRR